MITKPSWAEALIVAELEENTSDIQSDYFGSRTLRTVALAWSKSKRDNFAEMRKAAATFPETAIYGPGCDRFTARVVLVDEVVSNGQAYWKGSYSHWHSELYGESMMDAPVFRTLAEAQAFIAEKGDPEPITFQVDAGGSKLVTFRWDIHRSSVENREKWSMGHGYYLGDSKYSGWQVRKVSPDYATRNDVDTSRLEAKPKPAAAAPAATSVDGVTVTLNTDKNGVEIRFPAKPAAAVLDSLKANGWRWSRFSSCWYQRDTPQARAFAASLQGGGSFADDISQAMSDWNRATPEQRDAALRTAAELADATPSQTPEAQGFKVGGWINVR